MSRSPERVAAVRALVTAALVLAIAAMGVWALWPVYESGTFLIAAGAAALVGALVPAAAAVLGWRTRVITAVLLVFYLLAGVPLTMPERLGGGASGLLGAALDLLTGPVLGWKDLVTLPIPVGSFRATVVPAFAGVLLTSAVAVTVALRSRRWWGVGPLVMALVPVAATALGAATPTAADAGWADVLTGRSWLVGLGTFTLCLGWLVWRANVVRRDALALVPAAALGTRTRSTSRAARSFAGGAAMLAVAVVGAVAVGVPLARGESRQVLRGSVDARLAVSSTLSPLTTYRSYLDDATYDSVLFTVAVTSGEVDRVRIATLPVYDGIEFTASGADDETFRQVPARRKQGGDGATVTVGIGTYSAIWAPAIADLSAVSFAGPRRDSLLNGFYYLPSSDAAVMVADGGLAAGDSYTITGDAAEVADLATIGRSPGAATISTELIPDSLSSWLDRQHLTADGAGLAEAVKRLRARGYLSHALTASAAVPLWQQDLGSYDFAPSFAGHSYERVDALFAALDEREAEVGTSGGASLVAAVGDDEQFATAIALVAAKMGFPSRVVIGVRLAPTDDLGWSAPPCDGGECRGKNVSVWTEVRTVTGSWVAIDATPQHTEQLSPDVTSQLDPKFGSPVDAAEIETVVPPSSARGDGATEDTSTTDEVAAAPWWRGAVRVIGAVGAAALVTLGPPLGIVLLKRSRRSRRRRGSPVDAVHGGWDEYLDLARDAGRAVSDQRTRREVAADLDSEAGLELAALADRATFAEDGVADHEVVRCWQLVAAERRRLLAALGWRGRWRATLSLRSITRRQAPPAMPALVTVAARQDWRAGRTSTHLPGTVRSRLTRVKASGRSRGARR